MENSIVEFVSNGCFQSFILKSWKWHGPLRSRALAIYGFTKRAISFCEAFYLLLPAKYRSKQLTIKFADFINIETKKAISQFFNDDGSVSIFDKKFYQDSCTTELFDLIYQVIGLDQYNAKKFLHDNSFIIDAGANIGTFSVFASNLSPGGAVYSFEPVRRTYELLRKNTQEYKNIFCYNLGLGEAKSKKEIFTYGAATGGSVLEDSEVFHSRPREYFIGSELVNITTIDDFVAENNIQRIDFIKIDTEGYEAQILRGAKKTIKRFKPIMVVSAYHNKSDKKILPQIVRSICSDYEYKLENIFEEDFVFICKA